MFSSGIVRGEVAGRRLVLGAAVPAAIGAGEAVLGPLETVPRGRLHGWGGRMLRLVLLVLGIWASLVAAGGSAEADTPSGVPAAPASGTDATLPPEAPSGSGQEAGGIDALPMPAVSADDPRTGSLV